MGEINFSQESVDLPQFATQNASGKAGIILKNMDRWSSSASVTIQANTVSVPAFLAKTVLFTQAVSYVVSTNDILRLYWHLHVEPAGNSSTPIGSNANGLCWIAWLEWDIGAGYVPVPNQSDMAQDIDSSSKYGSIVDNMNACTLIRHSLVFSNSGATVNTYSQKFSVYGQWYYKAPSNVNIQGLRLVARGMFEPIWISTSSKNAVQIVASSASHSCDVDAVELGYIQQRSL